MRAAWQRLGPLGLIAALVSALWLPAQLAEAGAFRGPDCACPCSTQAGEPDPASLERPPCCAQDDADVGSPSVVVPPSPAGVAAPSVFEPVPLRSTEAQSQAPCTAPVRATGPPVWLALQRVIR